MPRNESPLQSEMLQGTLDLLILKTLVLGAAHGHTIAHAIERGSEDVLQVEHGSLYPAFHRLEGRGWIASFWGTSENNRKAKYYRLTPDGRKQLTAQTDALGAGGSRDWPNPETGGGVNGMNWGYLLRRAKWDRERFEEIESYVRIETDENIARGMPYAEARAAARRKLGNRTLVREEIYRMNTVAFLDTLVSRFPLRPAYAGQESDIHGSGAAHARDWNRGQYGGLQRAEFRGAGAVALSEAGRNWWRSGNSPGRRGTGEFLRGPAAFALDVLHVRRA